MLALFYSYPQATTRYTRPNRFAREAKVALRTLETLEVEGKRVLVRADFNVPLKDGVIGDDSRIRATVPTLQKLLGGGATLILMSHLGRPKAPEDKSRLGPVAERLSELLGQDVRYLPTSGPASDEQAAFVAEAEPGSVTLLENTRFDSRETKNDPAMAKKLAEYADVFVSDAFGAAHRVQLRAGLSIIGSNLQGLEEPTLRRIPIGAGLRPLAQRAVGIQFAVTGFFRGIRGGGRVGSQAFERLRGLFVLLALV